VWVLQPSSMLATTWAAAAAAAVLGVAVASLRGHVDPQATWAMRTTSKSSRVKSFMMGVAGLPG
jgi:hypothetical protein